MLSLFFLEKWQRIGIVTKQMQISKKFVIPIRSFDRVKI